MNMMRKNNNNRHNNNNNRGNRGGRYNNGGNRSNGGNRGGANDGQNLQRQKHHATQQLGKYSDLARNAQNNGDRVDVEYYLQHVDHYTRVLADIAAIEAERHAHSREAYVAQHTPAEATETEGEQAAPAEAAEGDVAGGESPAPRPHRQPRRQPREAAAPAAVVDNGAAAANSNHEEIPLPGAILPPI